MQPVEIGNVARRNAQPVIGSAREQLAFEDLVEAFNRAFECGQRLFALRRQADVDKYVEAEPDALGSQPRGITGDDPRRLERADAAMARRRRQANRFAQLGGGSRTMR